MTLICLRDGCMDPIVNRRPETRYCSDKCRTAQWKADHPDWRENGRERIVDRRQRSGLQVSYRKAIEVVYDLIVEYTGEILTRSEMRRLIEDAMAEALSPAQRARLEARS